jgi:hypothetical protein
VQPGLVQICTDVHWMMMSMSKHFYTFTCVITNLYMFSYMYTRCALLFVFCLFYWAELWLVKKIVYTVWLQIQWLERIVYTSRFSVIFQNSQNCRQITATHRRSVFHAAKCLQMLYKAKNQKITYFHNQIKNPLELRLVYIVPFGSDGSHGPQGAMGPGVRAGESGRQGRALLIKYPNPKQKRKNVHTSRFWVIWESSQNGVCLVGKSFPHPVGVFCTHQEPPGCRISKIILGEGGQGESGGSGMSGRQAVRASTAGPTGSRPQALLHTWLWKVKLISDS